MDQFSKVIDCTNSELQSSVIKPKNKKLCSYSDCKKKLSIIDLSTPCRCEKCFCTAHKFYDSHDCQYNYKENAHAELSRKNPKLVGKKIDVF